MWYYDWMCSYYCLHALMASLKLFSFPSSIQNMHVCVHTYFNKLFEVPTNAASYEGSLKRKWVCQSRASYRRIHCTWERSMYHHYYIGKKIIIEKSSDIKIEFLSGIVSVPTKLMRQAQFLQKKKKNIAHISSSWATHSYQLKQTRGVILIQ